tara:strand:- start:184 stop:714 length:531 start_codon:yes stop_codon:yes gene_type:complete
VIKLKNILNESRYFLDKFKGEELSRKQFSQINTELKHLKFGLKDLERGVKQQNNRVTLDNIQYLSNKISDVRKVLGLKEQNFSGITDTGLGYSNPEAQKFSVDAVNKAGKEIGKAQQRAVSIFTSDMKNGRYDKFDLVRSIKDGNIKDTSFSKRNVLKQLYYDVRDRFNQYGRRKK